jgi:hypothetical protein
MNETDSRGRRITSYVEAEVASSGVEARLVRISGRGQSFILLTNIYEGTMADLERCMEELRKSGYKASFVENDIFGEDRPKLIVRCQGFNVEIDERIGVVIDKINHFSLFKHPDFRISCGYPEKSYFFRLTDEELVDRVVRYVEEASEIMTNLPIGFRPSDR